MTRFMVSLVAMVFVVGAFASRAWAGKAFGVEKFESSIMSNVEGAGGGVPDLQAGSHPYAMTTTMVFNHVVTGIEEERIRVRTFGDPKDIEVESAPGGDRGSPSDRREMHRGAARESRRIDRLPKCRRGRGLLRLPRRHRNSRRTGLQHGASGGRAGRAGLQCGGDRVDHARRRQGAHRLTTACRRTSPASPMNTRSTASN